MDSRADDSPRYFESAASRFLLTSRDRSLLAKSQRAVSESRYGSFVVHGLDQQFWKAPAHDPATMRRTWESIQEVIGRALDPLTKELVYVTVSRRISAVTVLHLTQRQPQEGMTNEMSSELTAITGMANETHRLASRYEVEIAPEVKARSPDDYRRTTAEKKRLIPRLDDTEIQ